MNKNFLSVTPSIGMWVFCFSVEAQQTKKVPRIGYLSPFAAASEPSKPVFEAFHQASVNSVGFRGKM